MQTLIKKYPILGAVALILPAGYPLLQAVAGGSEGHGGNRYTIEFQAAARVGLVLLQGLDASAFPSVNRVALAEKIDTVALSSEVAALSGTAKSRTRVAVPNPSNGKFVWETRCAVNYPSSSEIVLSEKCWDSEGMRDNLVLKITVALHEYFSFIGVEQDSSPISSAIAAKIYEKTKFDRERILAKAGALREAFRSAKPADTLDSILAKPMDYGRPWTCTEVSELSQFPYETTLPAAYAFRDDLMSVGADGKDPLGRVTHFERSPFGLTSIPTKAEADTTVIRVSMEGDLLIEKVNPKPRPSDDPARLAPSIAMPGRTVSAYQICSLFPSRMKSRLEDLKSASREVYSFELTGVEEAIAQVKNSAVYHRCLEKNKSKDCTDALYAFHNALEMNPAWSTVARKSLQSQWTELRSWAASLSVPSRQLLATDAYTRLLAKWNDLEAEYLAKFEDGYSFHTLVSLRSNEDLKQRSQSGIPSLQARIYGVLGAYDKVLADYQSRRAKVLQGLADEIEAISNEVEHYSGE